MCLKARSASGASRTNLQAQCTRPPARRSTWQNGDALPRWADFAAHSKSLCWLANYPPALRGGVWFSFAAPGGLHPHPPFKVPVHTCGIIPPNHYIAAAKHGTRPETVDSAFKAVLLQIKDTINRETTDSTDRGQQTCGLAREFSHWHPSATTEEPRLRWINGNSINSSVHTILQAGIF